MYKRQEYHFAVLIIWRSLVQAQAGPLKKVVTHVVTTFFSVSNTLNSNLQFHRKKSRQPLAYLPANPSFYADINTNIMQITRSILLVILLLLPGIMKSQTEVSSLNYKFRRVSPEGGLEYNGQRDAKQDKWGFVWVDVYKRQLVRLPCVDATIPNWFILSSTRDMVFLS